MKTLIIYESKTGSTQKYAEAIASATAATLLPLKKFKEKMVRDYDCIVFAGWVMAGQIQGINKFLTAQAYLEGKEVIVLAVGMTPASPEARNQLIDSNVLYDYHFRFYQLQGSFDYSKLDWKTKFIIEHSFQKLAEGNSSLLDFKDRPLYYYDQEKVTKIISVINTLSASK